MSEAEERGYVKSTLDGMKEATGATPRGWLGPEYGESPRTPQILVEAGLSYVCDWTNDEQPFPMKTPVGKLYALPSMLLLDDVNALWDRKITIGKYIRMIQESFDTVYEQGADNGRAMVLHLRPWLSGQPFRVRYLDGVLGRIMNKKEVWNATGSEIIDWYKANPPA